MELTGANPTHTDPTTTDPTVEDPATTDPVVPDLAEAARRHVAAWSAGDPAAITAAVTSFADPDTAEPLTGDALTGHVAAVLTRFAELKLEADDPVVTGGTAVVAWTLRAVHRDAYLGMPGTGGAVEVSGVDVLTARDGGVHARRVFDRLAVADALGYTARFVPASDGDREFGVSSRTPARASAAGVAPGALVLTWLDIRDGAEAADVDLLSVEIVKGLRASKGFLGASSFDVGLRKYTLTAFDSVDAVRAVHARPHQRAMRRFFRGGLCTGAATGVWVPLRDSVYARCPDCASVVTLDREHPDKSCDCGWTPIPGALF
ncbi:ester cyclase [Saccharothrix hoggarensis]|uniref:Ester cyclase n=1 Tax=Saccharothrix hoggarensis TaxID=913853 RepID=A0ABW3QWV8_9PSEU